MCNLLTPPAEAFLPDADRGGPGGPVHSLERLVRCIALLILFLHDPLKAVRLLRSGRLWSWHQDRPDLPPGSAQAEAASIRGQFGTAIAWMCRRHGVGPGHPEWPELSRAIVAFGGSLAGYRTDAPPCMLQWWTNPNIVPGVVPGFGAPAAGAASLLQLQAVANAAAPAPNVMRAVNATQAVAAHAMSPASWVSAAGRHVFARAGPGPSTGPPGSPGLPHLSCLMNGAGARSAPPS
jgi:hypothetical protein